MAADQEIIQKHTENKKKAREFYALVERRKDPRYNSLDFAKKIIPEVVADGF